jgi:phage shock protein A
MDETYKKLENKIKVLIERYQKLERDKEALDAKNKAAISQLEDMITRLKSIEQPS